MKGKTIVATGATSGIGEVAVLALAGLGARIVFIARDEVRAQATMSKLEAKAPGLGHRAIERAGGFGRAGEREALLVYGHRSVLSRPW